MMPGMDGDVPRQWVICLALRRMLFHPTCAGNEALSDSIEARLAVEVDRCVRSLTAHMDSEIAALLDGAYD